MTRAQVQELILAQVNKFSPEYEENGGKLLEVYSFQSTGYDNNMLTKILQEMQNGEVDEHFEFYQSILQYDGTELEDEYYNKKIFRNSITGEEHTLKEWKGIFKKGNIVDEDGDAFDNFDHFNGYCLDEVL